MKVGSDRQAASRQRGNGKVSPRSAIQQYRFCAGGSSKIGASMGRFTPKKVLGGTRAKRQSYSGVRELCWRSDAQMLSQIAHRSLVFLGRIFGLGRPKLSQKPFRVLPDFETVPKPSRVQASLVVRVQVSIMLEI